MNIWHDLSVSNLINLGVRQGMNKILKDLKQEFPTSKYSWNVTRKKNDKTESVLATVSNTKSDAVVLTLEGGKHLDNDQFFLSVNYFERNV